MKKIFMLSLVVVVPLLVIPIAASCQEGSMAPVTINASPEARALLKFFYSISGQYILTGQHNYPNVRGKNTKFAAEYIGKTPVVYSTDWGFAFDGNSDSYLARQDIVNEAIRQNKLGAIITICWHAVPPTADEPVTFQPVTGADSTRLHSVQGHMLDWQFRDVLTPGTALYKHWCQQVDSIAVYLKKLEDAHVPVIWRPYHEMNGEWFWWGGLRGEFSTIRLYRQLFDRLVNYHKLTNLIWMWNVDRPSTPARKFTNFYVGSNYFDIASLDVYGSDFKQSYYDSLLVLAKGKPVTLGEVGNPPTAEILRDQPRWAYYVICAGMARNTTRKQYDVLKADSRVLFLEDTAYWNAIAPYRAAAGLPSMYAGQNRFTDFSGAWVLDENASHLDDRGTTIVSSELNVTQDDNNLDIKRTMVSEYSENKVTEQNLPLDGTEREVNSANGNGAMTTSARRSAGGDTLYISSRTSVKRDGRTMVMLFGETWSLDSEGTSLVIRQSSDAFGSKRAIVVVYRRLQ